MRKGVSCYCKEEDPEGPTLCQGLCAQRDMYPKEHFDAFFKALDNFLCGRMEKDVKGKTVLFIGTGDAGKSAICETCIGIVPDHRKVAFGTGKYCWDALTAKIANKCLILHNLELRLEDDVKAGPLLQCLCGEGGTIEGKHKSQKETKGLFNKLFAFFACNKETTTKWGDGDLDAFESKVCFYELRGGTT